jgi:hypothetical protein
MVFDSSGEFIRTVGRDGQGPGEFSTGAMLLPHQDGLEVLDGLRGRRTRYSPAFEILDTDQFLAVLDRDFIRVGQHYVRSRRYAAAMDDRATVHVISDDGEYVRSFGTPTPSRDTRRSASHSRRFTPSSDTTFWSGDLLQYRLRHWTLGGNLIGEVTREVEWFEPQDRFGILDDGPTPGLVALSYDPEADVLWSAIAVAKPDWEARATLGPQVVPQVSSRPEAESVYMTIIEAIDPATGEVLGRTQIDAYVDSDAGPGVFFAEARTQYGEPVVRVWRVELAR